MRTSILICPSCSAPLTSFNSKKGCSKCGQYQEFSEKGVYSFLKEGYYWGEIPPEDMKAVLLLSKKIGWRKAVQKLIKTYPKMEEYLLNHARIDWIFHCLPSQSTGRCLDIGSGWGGLAFGLTNFFDEVYSLEAVKERFEFQKIRKSQEKLENLNIVRGNFLHLPFADNSFDLIAVNGVMEWAGIADYSKAAPEVQKDFLREIYRVLKPGGVVYVGIENRFGLHYLLGAEDHSGLPFTSIMPRFLADLTVRYLRKTEGKYKLQIRMEKDWQDYRTYTYTLDGYKHLLGEAGFKTVNPYWTLFYSNPKFSGPMDGMSFKFFLQYIASNTSGGKKSLGGLISKLGNIAPLWACKLMAVWFAPSFLLYAYKPIKSNSKLKIDTLEGEVRSKANTHTSFLKMGGSAAETSKINYFFLNNEKIVEVAKFARFSKADSFMRQEEKRAVLYGNIQKPKSYEMQKRTVFFETPIEGRHIQLGTGSETKLALTWLFNFQKQTVQKSKIDQQKAILHLKNRVRDLALSEKQVKRITRNLNDFSVLLKKTPLPTVSIHGDFCARNILIHKSDVYVLDWEDFSEKGSPLIDFVFFVIHSLAHLNSTNEIVKNFKNHENNEFVNSSFVRFSEIYNVNIKLLKLSLTYVALWYLVKFMDDGKHLGHGTFYLSILKNYHL